MIDPADQLQIGEWVLYIQEGVCSRVSGYVWHEQVGALPKIALYELECGVRLPRGAIKRIPPLGESWGRWGECDRIKFGDADPPPPRPSEPSGAS